MLSLMYDTACMRPVSGVYTADGNTGGWGTRGGGTRGREGGGGKWAGLDPVVPVTSRDLLNSVAAFYGCAKCSLLP